MKDAVRRWWWTNALLANAKLLSHKSHNFHVYLNGRKLISLTFHFHFLGTFCHHRCCCCYSPWHCIHSIFFCRTFFPFSCRMTNRTDFSPFLFFLVLLFGCNFCVLIFADDRLWPSDNEHVDVCPHIIHKQQYKNSDDIIIFGLFHSIWKWLEYCLSRDWMAVSDGESIFLSLSLSIHTHFIISSLALCSNQFYWW